MNKSVVIIILVLFVIGSIIALRTYTTSPAQSVTPTQQTDTTIVSSTGRYIEYSKESFDSVSDKRRILYFHANWCPTCRPLNQELLAKMDQIPEGVVIIKTDYDSETDLKQKYAVTYQHTFVEVDASGNEIQKWSGGNFNDVMEKL